MKLTSRFIFLLCIGLSLNLRGQSNIDLFEQAETAYSNEQYEEAVNDYESILKSGQDAFEVYYNLGNAYYKLDRIGPAILNYERAARIVPTDEDLQHNLAMAQSRTVDKIDLLPVPELLTNYTSFVNVFSADQWGMYSIVAFVLFLGGLAAFLFLTQKWLKQLLLTLSLGSLALALVFFFFGWQQQSWLNNNQEGIVFSSPISVLSAPNGDTGKELFVLHEGTKVQIKEQFKEWYKIQIGNGNNGWVPIADVEPI